MLDPKDTPKLPPGEGVNPVSMIPVQDVPPQELSKAGGGRDLYPGVATKPFEPKCREILTKEFEPLEYELTPDGIVYLPAVRFRDRFDQAFGQGRWALVRKTAWSDPRTMGNTIMATFHLYVDQRYINESTGGQTYFEKNSRMSYDDAIEGATSNGLMRCAKKLGVGRKVWDPNFRRQWRKENATRVWCTNEKPQQNGKYLWHRNDDPEAIQWPWKIVGGAPQTARPQSRSGGGGGTRPPASQPAPTRPAPQQSTGGPPPEETGLNEDDIQILACEIMAMGKPLKSGDVTTIKFQVKDELGNFFWGQTSEDEKADVLKSAFLSGTQVEMAFKQNRGDLRDLRGVSPIID